MLDTAQNLLSTLHSNLSSLNGYVCLAPKNAAYPLMTYNLIGSKDGRVKSFTSDSRIYTVQFSYFSDVTINDCIKLALSAENVLDTLSTFFDIDKGNISILGNTEQHRYYQFNDIRQIEIGKDLP